MEIRGTLPADITGQIGLAWKHILSVLEQANMDLTDVVKVTQYLTRAEGYCRLREGENSFLGDAEPASMLLLVPQFVRREFLVEVEVIAATEP